ncbi:hypothetical protein EI94DRAFT_1830878, partial [Lactarius quietus]
MSPCKANSSSREYKWQAIDTKIKSIEESIRESKHHRNALAYASEVEQRYIGQVDDVPMQEQSIRALKHRRNALAPVSSLPTEIIAAIFLFLCLPTGAPPFLYIHSWIIAVKFPESRPPSTVRWHHRDWLHAAHVCHQWREIALNDPLFWSHVDFTQLTSTGAAEILARAKTVPLYLEAGREFNDYFWMDSARCSAFERVLQARVTYICHLRITAERHSLSQTLDGLVSAAPTLEYLSLSQGNPGMDTSVPDTLFDGTTPRLSRLELCLCDINWSSPLLKGLQYLSICSLSKSARPSLTVWLDALDEMPQLKELVLDTASPIAPPIPFDIERTVTLLSLTHLNFSASAGD